MTEWTKLKTGLIAFAVLVCFGCNRAASPNGLSGRIANADRAIIWDWQHVDHGLVLGDEARDLVKAVSHATLSAKSYGRKFDKSIDFLQGTNLLATIYFQGRSFQTYDGQYRDDSLILNSIYRHFPDDDARSNGVQCLAQDVLRSNLLARVQGWAIETTERYNGGQFEKVFHKGSDGTEVVATEVPEWLRKLRWPDARVSLWLDDGKARCLVVDWHSVSGLLVGPTNFTPVPAPRFLTNLCPGVYAFHY